jgi:hypothetical protein
MKTIGDARRVATVALIVLAMAVLPAAPSDAGGGGRGQGQGGGKQGGGHKHGERHGKHFHHGSRSAAFIGAGPWWWAPYWYDPWPYWQAPPPVIQAPPVYIEQSPAAYWHYCQDPPGYYPSVQQCPTEWLKVLPQLGR